MSLPVIHAWKKIPVLRILIPFIAGIIIQWQWKFTNKILLASVIISAFIVISFFLLKFLDRFRFSFLSGVGVIFLFLSIGALLTRHNDVRNDKNWFGKYYSRESSMVITLLEDPVEKTKSFKADASVDYILETDSITSSAGKIILYLKKDSTVTNLHYGDRLLISKSLQEIRNSGNPGGFNYKQYALFQGITHQVYLKENEFEILPGTNKNLIKTFLKNIRLEVLKILRKYIHGEKELGLAEALLIGYKNDLDKTLVQSYSNTGVVHIIAISGLHLGLIYWLLTLLFKPLKKRKKLIWLSITLIVCGLWLFSLLAGGQPSVIRSAVMFTCIVFAEGLARNTSIYNTLGFSAFLLLCYNPFWLWDVGFQLSYAAVLSIVTFMQPIYNWLYIKNKILDFIWKLNSITIAAQLFTIPLSIYHFHQFPTGFLFTNFLAVPLSGIILLGEIALCIASLIPAPAVILGNVLSFLIALMNSYIERIEQIPFTLWDSLQTSIPQTILLLISVSAIGYWLLEKSRQLFRLGITAFTVFLILRTISFINAGNQEKIIVYNVPQKMAIDFIDKRNYLFAGDSDLLADDFIRNFHITPSRILHRIEPASQLNDLIVSGNFFQFKKKKVLVINSNAHFTPSNEKIEIDLLIISKNPKIYFKQLNESLKIKQVVFDGSCPSWKISYWKRDCDSLHIPYHDVNSSGAYALNVW